jgi:hypothetical protein
VGSSVVGFLQHATEWSGGSVVALEEPPDAVSREALSINGVVQAVGDNYIDGETHAVNGSAAALSISEACRAPRSIKRTASTTRDR